MSQTEKVLEFNGRKFILIGTAHISKESCLEVENAVAEKKPDVVAIELDEGRYASLNDSENWRNLDIVKVLKKKQGFLLLANLMLSSFQKRMGQNVGVKPGDEMRAADNAAKKLNIPVALVDRPIQTTLSRAWSLNSFWGKCKLLAALIASAFSKEEVSGEEIENLKNSSEMDSMMKELSDYMPGIKKVLIDERDRYLASKIWECKGNTVLAVLGAGHLPGVIEYLEKLASSVSSDCSDIEVVPPKKKSSRVLGWIIPVIIVAAIAAGFIYGGMAKGSQMVGSWILWNAVLSAVGTIIAMGHPVTVLVAFVAAPITSLCPVIGVGMFTGLVQAVIQKPKVRDMELLQDEVSSVKGFYKNRILKVFLVFVLSTLGSAIGTFIAGADIFTQFTSISGSLQG